MTDQSTKLLDELATMVAGLSHYYIKESHIATKYEYNSRVLFSRYRLIDEPPSKILLKQHLNKEIEVAIPTPPNGYNQRVVFLFEGKESKEFLQILKSMLSYLNIKDTKLYKERSKNCVQVHILLSTTNPNEAYNKAVELSNMLQKRVTKSWKVLPNPNIPQIKAIYPLPYQYIE